MPHATIETLFLHRGLPSTIAVQIEDADSEGVGDLSPSLTITSRAGTALGDAIDLDHSSGGVYTGELGTELYDVTYPGLWLRAVIEFVDGDSNECTITRPVLVVPG